MPLTFTQGLLAGALLLPATAVSQTPAPPSGDGQNRGNSGVFLLGLYEVQVLDSYQNRTYADGMAGAVYGQYPPLVNASRPPGEWQSYDIVFRRHGVPVRFRNIWIRDLEGG